MSVREPPKNGSSPPGTAYQRLATTIREAIIAGDLEPGQLLPTELELAGREGVSRSTVREALRLLQESGYIERPSPRKMVVRAPDEQAASQAFLQALKRRTVTFATLHEALMLLDPELARLAAVRRTAGDLETLRANLAEQRAHSNDFLRWCRLDEDFHVAIAEAGENGPLVLTRATLGLVLLPTVSQFVITERASIAGTEFHQRIYDAIAEGDPDLAMLVARRHIEDFRLAWERSGLAYDRDISGLIGEAEARLEP